MKTQSFGKWLPYWATRTVATSLGAVPVIIMKDGTLVVGVEVAGVDVYCSDNAVLDRTAGSIRQALNLLPENGFLQAVFETGFGFQSLLGSFSQLLGVRAHPIIKEARRRRTAMLAAQKGLSRSRITYWIGVVEALGPLAPHKSKPRAKPSLIARRRHPTQLTAELIASAAERLAVTTAQLTDTLSAAALATRLLSETEMLAECHRAINPLSAKDVPPPVIVETRDDLHRMKSGERAVFRGPSLASQLPLGCLSWQGDYLVIDDPPVPHRVLALQRYPFATDAACMFPVQYKHAPSHPMRLVVTHVATDRQLNKEELERKRNLVQAQMAKKTMDHEAAAAYSDYEQLLSRIATTDTRVFSSSLHVALCAPDLAALDTATREVKKGFVEAGAVVTTLTNQQLTGWLATLPGNGYRARNPYPLLTENCAHLTPYFQPSLGDGDAPDFLFTTRQRSLHAVSWRQAGSRDNTNTFIIGSTGSGKTFYFSHILKTTLSLGGHVVVADTKGPVNSTYRPTSDLLGGHYIALDAADDSISFNPCPAQHVVRNEDGSFGRAADYLRDVVCMMTVPDIDTTRNRDFHARIATDAIAAAYEKMARQDRTPILSDIADALASYVAPNDDFEPLARDMALRLRLWCEDKRRGALLNRPTSMPADNPFQVFDFFGLGNDPALAAVLISTLSARIFDKMQSLPLSTPKIFCFDEAWAFFDHSDLAAGLISGLFRVARSYGASCFVASQSYKDVSESRAATAMMANASVYVLNRHNSEHEAVGAVFGLTARQLELFRDLQFCKGEYAEQLHVDRHSNRAAVLRYAPTAWELWIDTSRAVDMELRTLVQRRLGNPLAALRYLADCYPTGATPEALEDERAQAESRRVQQGVVPASKFTNCDLGRTEITRA